MAVAIYPEICYDATRNQEREVIALKKTLVTILINLLLTLALLAAGMFGWQW